MLRRASQIRVGRPKVEAEVATPDGEEEQQLRESTVSGLPAALFILLGLLSSTRAIYCGRGSAMGQ